MGVWGDDDMLKKVNLLDAANTGGAYDDNDDKGQAHSGKLDLIGAQKFEAYDNMYKIVDFLNRNLRKHNLMFGLSKEQDAMTMTIYEVE